MKLVVNPICLYIVETPLSTACSWFLAKADPLPFPALDLVQEIIITRLSEKYVASMDPAMYTDMLKRHINETKNDDNAPAIRAHEAIMEQAVANLIHIDRLKLSDSKAVQGILVKLDQLARFQSNRGGSAAISALASMASTDIDIWSDGNKLSTAKAMASLLSTDLEFDGEDWAVWWVEILLACDDIINDEFNEAVVIKHGKRALFAHLLHHGQFSDKQVAELGGIQHLGLLLLAMTVTQSTALAKSVLSGEMTRKAGRKPWAPSKQWTDFIDICHVYLGAQTSPNETLLRACIVGSSLDLYDQIYKQRLFYLEVLLFT
jgi:hypothetical protein